MGKLPIAVASFWTGSDLSFFERLCILSFQEAGYEYHLFTLGKVGNIPDGVIVKDANTIFDGALGNSEDARFNAGVYSDVFRANLLRKTDLLWVDLDVYCFAPITEDLPYIFGVHRRRKKSNNCVLRLPKDSPALQLMLNFYEAKSPIPVWWREPKLNGLLRDMAKGYRPSLTTLPWTTTGPGVLSWALGRTGEIAQGQHWHRYYRFDQALDYEFLTPGTALDAYEPVGTNFVHLFGSTKVHMRDDFGGIPPEGSYIDTLCKRHGINPTAHPIPNTPGSLQPVPEQQVS